jgi:ankyrin repeat protein
MRKKKPQNSITKLNSIIHLENLGIDISDRIDRIRVIFCHAKNLSGIDYCLKNGANPDDILINVRNLTIDIIKCAIPYGINLNLINLNQLRSLIIADDGNLDTFIYFVDNGLNLEAYFKELSVLCIVHTCPKTLEYFIKLGLDIHFDDELLLVYACRRSNIECVKLLLSHGANTDSILSFGGSRLLKYNKYYKTIHMSIHDNWLQIINILIEHGAIIYDPTYIFYIYLNEFNHWKDDRIFILSLEHGIDFNTMYNDKYILEFVAIYSDHLLKLCLKYGADPYINNHGPLKQAINYRNISSVKILLDLNSIVDPNLDCNTNQEIIDLLDQYQITHKLKSLSFYGSTYST